MRFDPQAGVRNRRFPLMPSGFVGARMDKNAVRTYLGRIEK
jgi:hypothetical protein